MWALAPPAFIDLLDQIAQMTTLIVLIFLQGLFSGGKKAKVGSLEVSRDWHSHGVHEFVDEGVSVANGRVNHSFSTCDILLTLSGDAEVFGKLTHLSISRQIGEGKMILALVGEFLADGWLEMMDEMICQVILKHGLVEKWTGPLKQSLVVFQN
jgi:hypothetical protein